MVEGNMESYSRILNSANQMERIKKVNEGLLLVRFMEKMTGHDRKQGHLQRKFEMQNKERKKVAVAGSIIGAEQACTCA